MTQTAQEGTAFLEQFTSTVSEAAYEESVLVTPRPRGVEPLSPVARSVEILFESLRREVVIPILEARTRDAYYRRVKGCWKKFEETVTAFRALRSAASLAEFEIDQDEFMHALRESVRALSGSDAVTEFDFDVATFNRAMNLGRRITGSPLVDPDSAERDRQFARAFNSHCGLFQFSLFVLSAAAAGPHRATAEAVEVTFELLRGSAMRAYVAVRQGAELRRALQPTPELAPFDEEDRHLAGLPA